MQRFRSFSFILLISEVDTAPQCVMVAALTMEVDVREFNKREIADGHKILMGRQDNLEGALGFRAIVYAPEVLKQIENKDFPFELIPRDQMTVHEWRDMFDAIEDNLVEAMSRVRRLRKLTDGEVEGCMRQLSNLDIIKFARIEHDRSFKKTDEEKSELRKKHSDNTAEFVRHFSK